LIRVQAQVAIGACPYVGRTPELSELRAALEEAIAGHGRLVLIAGEPGIGKSRLAAEVAREAGALGAIVLGGRCYEMEGSAPYMPFVEIMEAGLAQAPSAEGFRRELGEDAAEVARILPKLRRLFPDIPPPLALPPEQERRFFFNSICEVVARSARLRPLVLIVDDLQWADEPTLLLTEHLAQRLSQMPVLMLGTYRDTDLDVSRPLARTLDELLRRRLARRIRLARFSATEVEEALQGLSGQQPPASLSRAVHQETEGNPFFVEEVFRHLAEEGTLFDEQGRFRRALGARDVVVPEGVRLTIGRRLERFSEETRKVLTTAAMVGRDFALELLETLAESAGDAVLAALEEAERAGLITSFAREGTARFAFTHELIRQTLVAPLSLPRRQRLHLRVAEAIRQVYGGSLEEHAGELAYHFYQAGSLAESEDTARVLVLAGDRALEGAAFEDAARLYERALSLRKPQTAEWAEALGKLGQARLGFGDLADAVECLERALQTVDALGDLEAGGRLRRTLLMYYAFTARIFESFELAERGLAVIGDRVNADRCHMLAFRGALMSFMGDHEGGDAAIVEATRMAEQLGDAKAMAPVLWARVAHHLTCHRYHEILQDGARALPLLREANMPWEYSALLSLMQLAALGLGRFDEVLRIGGELEPLADRIGNADIMLGRRNRGAVELAMTGDFEKVAFLSADVEMCRQGVNNMLGPGLVFAGLVDLWSGNWESALDRLREGGTFQTGAVGGLWAFLSLAQAYAGKREEALQLIAERREELPRADRVNNTGAWIALFAVVEALAVSGEREQAAELHPFLVEAIEQGHVICGYYNLRCIETLAGLAAAAGRRWQVAEVHFQNALATADRLPHRLEQADARRFYAEMLLERGEPGDDERARVLLEEAIAGYERNGMPRHREIARKLLRPVASDRVAETTPPPAAGVFRREGQFWTIRFDGETFRLKDAKGLRFLAELLRNPGREIPATELASASGEGRPLATRIAPEEGAPAANLGDAGELLDAKAKAEYRERLDDLRSELKTAEAVDEAERATKLREEIDFLTRELASAVGLGGRDRKAASAVERARASVTLAIKSALKSISENSASLARHLNGTIRTGKFCSYSPDPCAPMSWST
jgi:tetratricopeptide (TPR) repeat protein